MSNLHSTSVRIFERLKAGRDDAADELFHRYVERLSRFARRRLAQRLSRRVDADDIVMSAYRSFFIATRDGRFSVSQTGDLWALLTTITLRKICRTGAHHSAQKRDLNLEVQSADSVNTQRQIVSGEPAPAEAAALADEVEFILRRLNAQHRRILELRLQGETTAEIAHELGISERTVRRTLQQIREDICRRHDLPKDSVADRPANAISVDDVDLTSNDQASSPLPQPTVSFDRLTLKKLVGRGGMGKVYTAIDRERNQLVAVKFLHKTFQADTTAVHRFVQEAAIISQLHHCGIVKTYGIGRTTGQVYFIVMDLIAGRSLDQLNLPVTVATAVRWTRFLADALNHAHAVGVIHCDLKPGNVLITDTDQPVIVDFGLARGLEHHQSAGIAGTAPWMAPEQIDSCFGPITERTDVYGLGALLYTLLTGRPPFSGSRVSDILSRIISAETPCLPSQLVNHIPANVDEICRLCPSTRPADRPASVSAVADRL